MCVDMVVLVPFLNRWYGASSNIWKNTSVTPLKPCYPSNIDFWTRHALCPEVFTLAYHGVKLRSGWIDIDDHARRSILLIFSLQLIREDRGQNGGFGSYWIVCHNRSPLQYVPMRDRYSIYTMKKSFKRERERDSYGAYRRGEITSAWRETAEKFALNVRDNSRVFLQRERSSTVPARRAGNTFRRDKREERVPRDSSPEADYSRFATKRRSLSLFPSASSPSPIRTRMA